MAKSNPKPWQRGYIPTNKPSPAKWVVPPAPPGWHAVGTKERNAAVFAEGTLSVGGRPNKYARLKLTAAKGQPWRLVHTSLAAQLRLHDEIVLGPGRTSEVLFEADNPDAVLVWLKIERESGEDPRVAPEVDVYQRWRTAAIPLMDFGKVERRVMANWVQERTVDKGTQMHQEFERYCKADVDHAADAPRLIGRLGVVEDVCVKK